MTASKKTDNHDPRAKLNLRRYFLEKYHPQGTARVLDCCMATGFLWKVLRSEWRVASYVGLDMKYKKGRLKIDSARYLEAGGWDHNCIDIDTYGAPWRHYVNALKQNKQAELTIFFTIGKGMKDLSRLDDVALESIGLKGLHVPASIQGKLHKLSINYCLAACYEYGMIPIDTQESQSTGNARYIGVRLRREK